MAIIDNIFSLPLPSGDDIGMYRHRFGQGHARVVFVAGLRGDAPEGIRVAFNIAEFLRNHEDSMLGMVDIFPCVNPLAAEQGVRHWPFFGLDQNRQFPGDKNGHPPAQVAYHLQQAIEGADFVVELRGARPGFSEIPQAIMNIDNDTLPEYAQYTNVSLIWRRNYGGSATKTLAYQFANSIVLEGGIGNQLTHEVGNRLFEGSLYLLSKIGIVPEEILPFPWMTMEEPQVAVDADIERIRSNRVGFFLPNIDVDASIQQGDTIGVIVDTMTGEQKEIISAPCTGRVIAIRNQPVVSAGSMVARIWKEHRATSPNTPSLDHWWAED
jgi:predicted deacylase